jgi:hypothetical protein
MRRQPDQLRRVYLVTKGGLGNQLFQAAFGVALKRRFGVEVLYHYEKDGLGRELLLDHFPALEFQRSTIDASDKVPAIDERDLPPSAVSSVLEKHASVIFNGYWQDEGYFFGEESAIRAAFQQQTDRGSIALGEQLRAEGAIGIHVRRSEYGQRGLAKVSYYRDAIEAIRREMGERRAICFNDEPVFCGAVFRHMPNFVVVKGGPQTTLRDFYLLSRCAHFVIANSSFSWWAAWLGANEGSIVYAPMPWCVFNNADPICSRGVALREQCKCNSASAIQRSLA